MVNSSRTIKSDVPCGLLMALSIWAFLGTRESPRLRPLVVASLLAGAAMGTHYYGVVLVPAYLALEALRGFSAGVPWRTAIARCALIVVLFVIGFFLASPYNFLDPTWGRTPGRRSPRASGSPGKPAASYDPDSDREFKPGAATSRGAAGAFLALVASQEVLGIALSLLALLGLAATFVRRETRWYGLLVLIPSPLLLPRGDHRGRLPCPGPPPERALPAAGDARLAGSARRRPAPSGSPPRRARAAALLLVAAAALPTLIATVQRNRRINRPDSRLAAYRWLRANLPGDARVLLDDYGPPLNEKPGEKIDVDMLPDGRIEVKAARPNGKISEAFNFLKQDNGPRLSIDEMNKIIADGWSGKR